MEINLKSQLELIEQEKLVSCKANAPIKGAGAIILDNQDLHILCKLAKCNNMEVILYYEKKTDPSAYQIDKEGVREEYFDCFDLMEKDIDDYNATLEDVTFDEAIGGQFYFVADGKYYIQEIQFADVSGQELPTAQEVLREILHKYSFEIEQMREKREEERKRAETERIALLKEFEEYVRKDFKFIEFDSPGHRRDYAKEVFRINDNAEHFRKLFYAENDTRCENRVHANQCYLELERIYQAMKQERDNYSKTEEYAQQLAAFEDLVHKDDSFWEFNFPGHRRDYSYQVFRSNPKAAQYRTLFYFDSDVECKAHQSRNECFYVLERIYKQGRKTETTINLSRLFSGKRE